MDAPYRVVDSDQRSWMLATEGYTADNHQTYLSLERVRAEHGPIRPVLPVTEHDRHALTQALTLAGRKAVYTLAVAVYRTLNAVRDDHGGMTQPRRSHELAIQQMRAGRPGSWEAARLLDMALWAGHGKPSRIHEPAAATMQQILYGWVTNPNRYTEVAETLASIVSTHTDSQKRGWRDVADQWLQPGALDREGLSITYSLLYSHGNGFDHSVLA